jgi:transposase InsO family protein
VTRYVEERRALFGVEPICRVLGVAVSRHYARRSRKPSRRELADLELLVEIEAARAGYRRAYGARKTWKELRRRGVDAGRDQVARVMRRHGIEGKLRGRKKRTTIPDEAAVDQARDLLQRDFAATAPNEKWACDLTYVRTWHGFRLPRLRARLLQPDDRRLAARNPHAYRARARRARNGQRPAPTGRGLIAHSDRGSQYTSIRYTDRLDEIGAAPSVGSRGDAYDNAMAEAWVATFKTELVDGRRFPSFEHAEHEALHWISFYNRERLHEALDDLPPAEYEAERSRLNYKEKQHPNPVRHLTTPPTNPGRIIASKPTVTF